MHRALHLVTSFGVLAGALGLLLADSAEPACASIPFDRIYTITTDCAGAASEVVRITLQSGETASTWATTSEHISGTALVKTSNLSGSCQEDGDPVELDTLFLELGPRPDGNQYGCSVSLDDGTASCNALNTTGTPCSVTVSPVL
jgi:hypothetical protein